MASLADRLDKQLTELKAERDRISTQAIANIGIVDEKIALLEGAKKLLSREIEGAYAALLKVGLVKEI